ncbi:MAG: hypothetical protein OEM84_02270 [Acidimicrobiia bacterium]|nr:hypothetical protein [Acidimicrobiia bacterium]
MASARSSEKGRPDDGEKRWVVAFDDELDGWTIAVTLESHTDGFVVRELHVSPTGATPPGGYQHAAHHRRIKPDRLRMLAIQSVLEHENPGYEKLVANAVRFSGRGRHKHDDLFYARLAASYSFHAKYGARHVHRKVATDNFLEATTVKDYIEEARRRGLLTRPQKKGVAGGELTTKARKLLEPLVKEARVAVHIPQVTIVTDRPRKQPEG